MRKLSRRQLGLGLGASLLAAPFLDLERPARASTGVAKRLVIMFSPNGTIPAYWTPTGSGTSFGFSPGSILQPLSGTMTALAGPGVAATPTAPVTDPAGVLPSSMLTSIQNDVIICGGLDFLNTSNHQPGMAAMLTGNGVATSPGIGMSIDQYVASKIGTSTKFPSLQFGVQTASGGATAETRMSYSAPNVFVPPEDDPVAAYTRMFGGSNDALLLTEQEQVISIATGELQALQARVGSAEQLKLGTHITSLQQLQKSLSTPTTCGMPAAPTNAPCEVNGNFPAVGKAQMDLLVESLACGMTNVASLQWSYTVGLPSLTWLGFPDFHHTLSHSDDSDTVGVTKFVTAERWFAMQFVYLVNKLKSTPDPSTPNSTSLLDTTLVVWTKELSDSRAHLCTGVPFVIAGTANGRWTTGRYVDFGGAPHNQLLVSICQAMGLPDTAFGDPTAATGPLSGLES